MFWQFFFLLFYLYEMWLLLLFVCFYFDLVSFCRWKLLLLLSSVSMICCSECKNILLRYRACAFILIGAQGARVSQHANQMQTQYLTRVTLLWEWFCLCMIFNGAEIIRKIRIRFSWLLLFCCGNLNTINHIKPLDCAPFKIEIFTL